MIFNGCTLDDTLGGLSGAVTGGIEEEELEEKKISASKNRGNVGRKRKDHLSTKRKRRKFG